MHMREQAMAITGIGAVSGYGWGTGCLWDGLLSGKPAATLVAGYGKNRDEDVWLSRVSDGGDRADGASLSARAMRAVAHEAIADALDRGWKPGRQVGLVHAVVISEMEEWRRFYCEDGGQRRVRDYLTLMPSTPVSLLMQEYGFHGPAMNVSAMCASGNAGLITAQMWLDCDVVDDVVFLATDLSMTPETVDHFVRMGVGVVDTEPLDACRPFQEGSRGFPMGEAAVAFVLTRRAHDAYAVVLGGAMSHDAYHVTSVDPVGTYVEACVRQALDRAGVAADAVRYLNAHGPGTQQCDRAETAILNEVLHGQAEVYSIKPLVGHCQGAASAVELAATAYAYTSGVIPAPPRVAPGHPRLLDGPSAMFEGVTLKTSLGMGGHNSAVVLASPRHAA